MIFSQQYFEKGTKLGIKKFQSNFPYKIGLILLSITTAVIAFSIAVYYAKQPILEFHGFRQTQTAITAYWILHEGWQLDYQTPAVGYPWSIPFEFPIYQSLVASIAYVGNFSLDPVGRFVSLTFLFACALPAFAISRRLELSPEVPWVFSALLWSSPLYLFWGRTFMIETAASFFTFAAIPYSIDLLEERPRWRSTLLFTFWMTLGMLQKITTALPIFIFVAVVLAAVHLKNFGSRLPAWGKIIQVLMAFAVTMIIGGLWAYYADTVKQQNVIGAEMTSRMLGSWNFGDLQQRLDLEIFKAIVWDRILARNLAGILGVFILGISLFFGERRTRIFLLVSLSLFLLPIEMFINLHSVHDYYQTSSVLFLLGGLAIAIVDLKRTIRWKAPIVLALTLVFVVFNLYIYRYSYWTLIDGLQNASNKSANQILLVSNVLNRYTPQGSVVVIYGMDWSSEIAYYAKRKSFTVPSWENKPDWPGKLGWQKKYDEIWQNPAPYLGGAEPGAIAYCTDRNNQYGIKVDIKEALKNQYVARQPRLFKVANCFLWLPDTGEVLLPGGNQIIHPVNLIEE